VADAVVSSDDAGFEAAPPCAFGSSSGGWRQRWRS
jgi:hypothetical protein